MRGAHLHLQQLSREPQTFLCTSQVRLPFQECKRENAQGNPSKRRFPRCIVLTASGAFTCSNPLMFIGGTVEKLSALARQVFLTVEPTARKAQNDK